MKERKEREGKTQHAKIIKKRYMMRPCFHSHFRVYLPRVFFVAAVVLGENGLRVIG